MDIKTEKIVRGYFNFPGRGIEYLEKQKKCSKLDKQKKLHLESTVEGLCAWFSNWSVHQNLPQCLLNHRFLGPNPEIFLMTANYRGQEALKIP